MSLFACGPTAVAHYRCAIVPSQPNDDPSKVDLSQAIYRASDIAATSLAGLCVLDPSEKTPLHFLVPNTRHRPRSDAYVAHVCTKPLPGEMFYRVSAEVQVTSPELTFVQMATKLELPVLIALGMELCGTYRRNVIGAAVPGFAVPQTIYDQPQLTTVEKLRAFIEGASSLPGAKQARRALDFMLDCSASPFETIVYLLLCLPRRMGGYALPVPELNPAIEFTDRARTFTLRGSARGDLYWRDAKLDLEYNGADHDDSRSADSMRRKALERMNIQVIELTNDEVEQAEIFHATVLRIAKTLGVRVRVERDFAARRAYLRDLLLGDTGGLGDDYETVVDTVSDGQAVEGEYPEDAERYADPDYEEGSGRMDDEWERNQWRDELKERARFEE